YGFRGEALASIAAVSRFTMTSRRRELDEASLLRVLDTGRKQVQPAGAPPGTTVLVEDLFFSFPARRKFLRSERSETASVVSVVLRTALFRPDVSFTLRSGARSLLDLDARTDPLDRVSDCLGPEVASALVPLETSGGHVARISGFIGLPSLHRHNRTSIFTAVGRRPVESRELINAVIIAYRGLLPDRRFPVAVISVDLPPQYVDINVHPAKKEARFRDPDSLTRLLRREISIALFSSRREPPASSLSAAPDDAPSVPAASPHHPPGGGAPESTPPAPPPVESPVRTAARRPGLWHGAARFSPPAQAPAAGERPPSPGSPPPPASPPPSVSADFLYIGQTSEGYLVVEVAGSLRIVDPHALHERVIYEKLRKSGSRPELLHLLFPAVVSLSASELPHKEALIDVLRSVGFGVDDFGPSDVSISSVPSAFEGGDPALVARDVLDALASGSSGDAPAAASRLRDAALASAACRAAVKLGRRFSAQEAVDFLQSASRLASVQVCPHGRPTSVDIDMVSIKGRLSR
ncbi:MAG: hypothetical protein JW909_09825, partial [Planctomycetes bacterium]|nr:hypothetical protein [Planctomycetota bacterium]